MLFSPREKKLANWQWLFHLGGLLLTLVTLAAVFLLLLWPLERRGLEIQRETAELQRLLDQEVQLRDDNRRLSEALSAADQKVEDLLARIPNLPHEADFLGQLTTLSRDVKLKIADYRPEGVRDNKEYQEMVVSLSSEGSYASICSFLHGLHQLPRLSDVRKLKVLPRPDGDSYAMDMTLAIYFAPKNKPAAQRGRTSDG